MPSSPSLCHGGAGLWSGEGFGDGQGSVQQNWACFREKEANNGQSGSQKFLESRLQWNNMGKKNILSIIFFLIINFYKASL